AKLLGSRLYVLADTRPTGHSYWSANSHLLCLELGEDGMPLEGELKVVDAPPDYAGLIERFLSSSDPGMDSVLVADIVSGGINPFRALLGSIPEMSPEQLDSLALLAAQLSPPPDPSAYIDEFDAADALVDWLVNNGSELLTDDMLRWQASGSLYWMQFTGPGIIAACGGSEAKRWLDEYYSPLLDEAASQPAGPVSLRPELTAIG